MTEEAVGEEGLAEACEAQKPQALKPEQNGIIVNVHESFEFIQFGLIVADQPITCDLDVCEAENLLEALNNAIKELKEKKSEE